MYMFIVMHLCTKSPSVICTCMCIFFIVFIYSFTAKHVSQRLWRQEVESMSSNTKIGNLEVTTCTSHAEHMHMYMCTCIIMHVSPKLHCILIC